MNSHEYCEKRRKYAWAKYFESLRKQLDVAVVTVREATNPTIAPHISKEFHDMATELQRTFSCPICTEMPTRESMTITLCGHIYCDFCLDLLKETPQPLCAMCRKPLSK